MTRRRPQRIINAIALTLGGICLTIAVAIGALVVRPSLAFSHTAGDGRIVFHATAPIPEEAALRASSEAWAALQDTPFGQPEHRVDVFLVGGGWRHRLFFAPARWAGGLTYPAFWQDRVFLREVDFEEGRLIYNGAPVPPPRNLIYYLVHEIMHLRHAEVVGGLAMFRAPHWVREGLPDLAALGPAEPALIAAARAGEELPRARYGSYPMERVCVSIALERAGMDMAQLLRLRAPLWGAEGCEIGPDAFSD